MLCRAALCGRSSTYAAKLPMLNCHADVACCAVQLVPSHHLCCSASKQRPCVVLCSAALGGRSSIHAAKPEKPEQPDKEGRTIAEGAPTMDMAEEAELTLDDLQQVCVHVSCFACLELGFRTGLRRHALPCELQQVICRLPLLCNMLPKECVKPQGIVLFFQCHDEALLGMMQVCLS